jgi:hypothetical protein
MVASSAWWRLLLLLLLTPNKGASGQYTTEAPGSNDDGSGGDLAIGLIAMALFIILPLAWARHKGWWPSWCCCQKKPSANKPQTGADSTRLPSTSSYVSMLFTSESEPPIRHVSTASSRAHECPPIHGLDTSYFEKETTWPTVMIRCVYTLTTSVPKSCSSILRPSPQTNKMCLPHCLVS